MKPKKQPEPVNAYKALEILFLRRYERPLSSKVDIAIRSARTGSGSEVVIIAGGRERERHIPWSNPTRRELAREAGLIDQPVIERSAEGKHPDDAIANLRRMLADEIALRIRSDIGALELAGHPWEGSAGNASQVIDVREDRAQPLHVIDTTKCWRYHRPMAKARRVASKPPEWDERRSVIEGERRKADRAAGKPDHVWSPSEARERLSRMLREHIERNGDRRKDGSAWTAQTRLRLAIHGMVESGGKIEAADVCEVPRLFTAFLGRIQNENDVELVTELTGSPRHTYASSSGQSVEASPVLAPEHERSHSVQGETASSRLNSGQGGAHAPVSTDSGDAGSDVHGDRSAQRR